MTRERNEAPPAWIVGLAGLILALIFVQTITDVYGDATGFLKVPAYDPALVSYVERHLGAVVFAPEAGHDGHFFFNLAMDPWLIDPEEHATFLDRPIYRAQRILYPMLAGAFGIASPRFAVLGLIFVNIAALAVGTWATSQLSTSLGGPPWSGLFFVLNPGLIFELSIDGSSILGMALAILGVRLSSQSRWTTAAALFALAALSRESMALFAVGVFAYSWVVRKRPIWRLIVIPALASVAWAAWARVRLSGLTDRATIPIFDDPFIGLSESIPHWFIQGGSSLWLGLITLTCAAVTILASLKRPSWLAWATVLFAPLLLILSSDVLRAGFDITRAVAPLITAGLVLMTAHLWRQPTLLRRATDFESQ